jgi:hypothetical protein
MEGVPVQLSYLRRPVAFLLLAAAFAAVAATWMRVVQTISEAKPVPAAGQATAIAWGDRVFASRAELAAWLRSRGTSYEAWSKTHQVAAGVVEHRPVKAAAPVRQPQPAQSTRPAQTESPEQTVPRVHSAPQPVHKVAASKHTVPAAAQASGDSRLRRVLVAMLVLLAAACAWGAALPTVVRDRFPALAFSVGRYRELFVTGAVALAVGLVVGVALN